MATTGERCRSSCPDVAYPLHHPVRRDQKAVTVVFNEEHRNRTRLTTFATTHGEERHRPYFEANTQQRHEKCVSHAVSEIHLKRFSHEYIPSFFS